MKKNIFVDLTSLLDVILIILFAVMLNLNSESEQLNKDINEVSEKNNLLIEENKILKEKLDFANNKLNITESMLDLQDKNINLISSNLSNWINISELEISEIITSNDLENEKEILSMLNQLTDKDNILENLYKYEALYSKFIFIDLTVKKEIRNLDDSITDKLYINDIDSGIYISSEEWYDKNKRDIKIMQISDAIENELDSKQGGTPLVLITYKHDKNVYLYVSNLINESINKIQSIYGNETTLKTEYVINSNEE